MRATYAPRPHPVLGVLCAALLAIGCADGTPMTTAPDILLAKKDCTADPNHPGCKDDGGGDGGDGTVRAGMTGAITMATHLMTSVRDSRWSLSMNTDASERGSADWNFTSSVDASQCVAENATVDDMLPHLEGSTTTAGFQMSYDKRSDDAPSDGHEVQLNVLDGTDVHVGFYAHGSPTGTAGTDAAGNETYTYSGTVRVWIKQGSPKTQPKLFCPTSASVTVTVER